MVIRNLISPTSVIVSYRVHIFLSVSFLNYYSVFCIYYKCKRNNLWHYQISKLPTYSVCITIQGHIVILGIRIGNVWLQEVIVNLTQHGSNVIYVFIELNKIISNKLHWMLSPVHIVLRNMYKFTIFNTYTKIIQYKY